MPEKVRGFLKITPAKIRVVAQYSNLCYKVPDYPEIYDLIFLADRISVS